MKAIEHIRDKAVAKQMLLNTNNKVGIFFILCLSVFLVYCVWEQMVRFRIECKIVGLFVFGWYLDVTCTFCTSWQQKNKKIMYVNPQTIKKNTKTAKISEDGKVHWNDSIYRCYSVACEYIFKCKYFIHSFILSPGKHFKWSKMCMVKKVAAAVAACRVLLKCSFPCMHIARLNLISCHSDYELCDVMSSQIFLLLRRSTSRILF